MITLDLSRSASKFGIRIGAFGNALGKAPFECLAASAEEEDELDEELEMARLDTVELELHELVEVELRCRRTFRRRFAMAPTAEL